MKKRYKIRVSGKVQGVWFRKNTMMKALEFGVLGYVQNLSDGSVYIDAEGSEKEVQQLIAWCLKGTERSRVDRVDVDEDEPAGYVGFEIK